MSSLPKLSTPIHYLTIPSTKKKVKYRPFFVKEEKIMMLVKESNSIKEIKNTLKEVISSCTFGKVNPDELSVFDIEYIFLQLRAKSVGESIELNMKCINDIEIPPVDDDDEPTIKTCGGIIPFEIDISKIRVKTPKNHTNSIILDGDIGISFKYPTIDTVVTVDDSDDDYNEFDLIVDLIDNIFDADNVYDAKDVKREELVEFVENITNKQFMDIREKFFDTMPSLEHTVKYKCSKCGYEDEYTFRGISDFF